ncbi:MAG: Smr/MutS family protein [Candidatus Latescibacteria bacterium]|nr:Smr/MutS family protein [Candidatus Latescibacterota bacterium]
MPWLRDAPALRCGDAPQRLEFPELLEELAARVRFPRSAEALRSLAPLTDSAAIEARRERVAAWIRLLDEGREPELAGLVDLGAGLERARRPGAQLPGDDLWTLARCLNALVRLGDFLAAQRERAPVLHGDWGNPPDLRGLASEIERCVDEEGAVRDGASPALARVRARIREGRDRLRGTLDALIRERLAEGERDLRPRLRSGRLVLPVRREQRSQLPGIVHDASSSGKTLFVEPLETVELNNALADLLAEESAECARILRALTARVGAWVDPIRERLDAAHRLELPLAAARLARERRWTWAEWSPAGEDRLVLKAAVHPLLARYLPAGRRPVPLDLDLDAASRLLLVTGPNTGGKTVMLKTLGLLVLMNQCGLPVPAAEGSRLPLFGSLFADIGDEQSLRDSHSTFSAHLARLGDMADGAAPDALILVDEIGDGTDPEEGAALAQALMAHWIGRGARAVVTTHFGVLKGFAQETDGAANAAMDFDPQARQPLYTLSLGIPGSSRAIATARRLGMNPEVLAEAERLLGAEALSLEALLERLERETQAAAEARADAQALRTRYEGMASEVEERLRHIRGEEREILAETRREAEDFLAAARRDFEHAVKALREREADRESIRDGHETLERLGAGLQRLEPSPARARAEALPPLEHWRAGDRVRLRATGQTAEILEAAGAGRLRVSLRGLPLVLPLAELSPLPPGDGGPAAGPAERDALAGVSYLAEAPDSYRLDLRGYRAEEAAEALDVFLDGAQLAGFHVVEILHGKGEGVLREEVRRRLAGDRRVAHFGLADQNRGGTGVTVATLAGGERRGGGHA